MEASSKTFSYLSAVSLIAIIVVTVYSNSFDATWHLDDYDNIVKNPGIHLTDLFPGSIIQSFYASIDGGLYIGKTLYRPVAMSSFALNWYWGQNHVFGYHLVNIIIHILSSIFLFLAVLSLLKAKSVAVESDSIRYQTALLCAVIWAIHPIHTSAVTYIVQRMASMAGMFYIMGLFFYVKIRLAQSSWLVTVLFCAGYIIAFVFGLLTKQNTILLPASTLLVEWVFFQKIPVRSLFKIKFFVLMAGFVLFFGVSAIIWTRGDIASLFAGYETRPYTPIERLMTQSRIVCMYLYQLIYPIASQFSVEHDVVISKSLFSPWTTLLSIGIIGSLIFWSLRSLKKYPLFAFAILFFFINHSVESTVLNLELFFEHRNYIPSMFFFLPVSLWMTTLLNEYSKNKEKRFIGGVVFGLVTIVIIAFGFGTYIRNIDWKTERSLWEAARNKAPGRARPYQSIGTLYYLKIGEWKKAEEFHKKALPLRDSKPATSKMICYDNLRSIYISMGKIDAAVECGAKAVRAKPEINVVYNYIETLVLADQLEVAENSIKNYFGKHFKRVQDINLQTIIYLKRQKFELAIESGLTAIEKAPFDVDATTYFGYANLVNRKYEKARYYLKKSLENNTPNAFFVRLCLIQNSLNEKSEEMSRFDVTQLIDDFSLERILKGLKDLKSVSYPLVPLEVNKIRDSILIQVSNKIVEANTF
ncbi:hypothetical protein [Desulfobacter curvatus]|uniref:hypothetical protein n=1 Tax=Desulfobacter curvatus TaxID=2290 RepID=UPI00037CAA78|nr:hypothetical protein [Desulfobacter curvatus]